MATPPHDHTAVKNLIYAHFEVRVAMWWVMYVYMCMRQNRHFQMKHRYDILDHLYEEKKFKNTKSHVATLCKPLAECECTIQVILLPPLLTVPFLPTFSGPHWRPSCTAHISGGRGSSWSPRESSCTKSRGCTTHRVWRSAHRGGRLRSHFLLGPPEGRYRDLVTYMCSF